MESDIIIYSYMSGHQLDGHHQAMIEALSIKYGPEAFPSLFLINLHRGQTIRTINMDGSTEILRDRGQSPVGINGVI